MSNRDWQRVSQILGGLLVLLVGASAAVVLLRAPGPGATPTPSPLAVASPSASTRPSGSLPASPSTRPSGSARPSASPTLPSEQPSESPTPTESPSPKPSPSPTPTPSPTPSPTPTLAPTADLRSIWLRNVGFDGTSATTPTNRSIHFRSEGPGQVDVRLFKVSVGEVRFCLTRESEAPTCLTADRGELTGESDPSGRTNWSVTLIGTGATSGDSNIRVSFRTNQPGVTLDGFRLEGTQDETRNGVQADIDVRDGNMRARGSFGGNPRPWAADISNEGGSLASNSDTSNEVEVQTSVAAGTVHLSITDTEEAAGADVFLHLVIRWP